MAGGRDCACGFGLVAEAPVDVAKVVFLDEVEPEFCLLLVEATVAGCVAGSKFGDEDGKSSFECALHFFAEGVGVGVGVEVEGVHDVLVAADWVCGGFVYIL